MELLNDKKEKKNTKINCIILSNRQKEKVLENTNKTHFDIFNKHGITSIKIVFHHDDNKKNKRTWN